MLPVFASVALDFGAVELSYGAWIVVVAVEDMTADVHAMMVYIEILC
jgi:hypothetical protein